MKRTYEFRLSIDVEIDGEPLADDVLQNAVETAVLEGAPAMIFESDECVVIAISTQIETLGTGS